jgi:hypothetical protein
MKRGLLAVAAFLLLLSTFVLPTIAHADGVPDGGGCTPNVNCKP